MGGLGKVFDGWNGMGKFLGSLRTQNQSREMDGFAQKAWRNFLVKWWNWWGFNDQENQIQIGWDKFCYLLGYIRSLFQAESLKNTYVNPCKKI